MGAISEIIPTFARKSIFGYKAIVASTMAISFIFVFMIGGLSRLVLGALATAVPLHDTAFVVAHFHFIVFGGLFVVCSVYRYLHPEAFKLAGEELDWVIGTVNTAFVVILGISLFFLVSITITMIYFVWRYNKKRNPNAANIEGNTKLEIIWTAIPTALVLVMFYFAGGLLLFYRSNTALVYVSKALLIKDFINNIGKTFIQINLYFLSVMIIIWADQLIR